MGELRAPPDHPAPQSIRTAVNMEINFNIEYGAVSSYILSFTEQLTKQSFTPRAL